MSFRNNSWRFWEFKRTTFRLISRTIVDGLNWSMTLKENRSSMMISGGAEMMGSAIKKEVGPPFLSAQECRPDPECTYVCFRNSLITILFSYWWRLTGNFYLAPSLSCRFHASFIRTEFGFLRDLVNDLGTRKMWKIPDMHPDICVAQDLNCGIQ